MVLGSGRGSKINISKIQRVSTMTSAVEKTKAGKKGGEYGRDEGEVGYN